MSTTTTATTAAAVKESACRVTSLLPGLETPCYVPPSIVGCVPHVTPDNYDKLPELQSQVLDYADIHATLDDLRAKGIAPRTFLNLPEHRLVLSARDYINGSNPPVSKAGFAIATPRGRRVVRPDELMRAAAALGPELVIPLADEVAVSFGANRQRAAMHQTLEWLDACLAARDGDETTATKTPVCGVIVGGTDPRVRGHCATETAKRDVQALLLSGVETTDDLAAREAMIASTLGALAEAAPSALALPRLVTGIGHPVEVIRAVAAGVDAFISSYPSTLTRAHGALICWHDPTADDTRVRRNERARSGAVLHLREKRFEKDFAPLLVDCPCYTCRHYTRAYVHHLLNVREMLGDTLLYLHNMHHYYALFRTLRARIADGTFGAFAEAFARAFVEKPSTAPPLPVPLAIAEREDRRQQDKRERAEQRAALAQAAAAKAKAEAHKAHTREIPPASAVVEMDQPAA